MGKSNAQGGPFRSLLEQLEAQWFTRTRVLNPDRTVWEQIINCRHCALEIRYDDNNHEQAAGAAALFLKHLKTNHADLLKQQSEIAIELL